MLTRQVKFIDENETVLGGIMINDDYIICGCCGGVIETEDVTILEIYDTWINISEEIIGE